MNPTESPDRWRLTDTFLVRRAGFAFDLLAECASPHSAALARQWAEITGRAEECRRMLLRELFPQAVTAARAHGDQARLRTLSALRSRVGARRNGTRPARPADAAVDQTYGAWIELCAQADQLVAKLTEIVPEDRRRAAKAMRVEAERADVADALLLLSPSFHQAVIRNRAATERSAGTVERAYERRLYTFLQRLAAKNETTSFFGPVTYGRFGDVDQPRFGPETVSGARSRRSFVSFWAAVEIAKVATRSVAVRERVPPRRLPVLRVVDGAALLPGRPPHPLSELERRVIEVCDGFRTTPEIAQVTGLPAAEVSAGLRSLEQQAFVQRRCEPSSTTFDPLGDVLRQIPDIPQVAVIRVGAERFAAAVAAFADAPQAHREAALDHAEVLFTAVTGRPARRNAGATYADRSVLFEDCEGDAQPALFPATWRSRINAQLSPVLDFGLAVGQAVRDSHRALAAELVTNTGPLPYLDFVNQMAAAVRAGRLEPLQGEVNRLRDGYRELVVSASDGRVARVDPDSLAELATPVPQPAFVSPDVLLSGDGMGILVLGEIHPYVFGWGLQGVFAPDPDALAEELRSVLGIWGGAERLATVLHRRRHKGLVSERFPGIFVEVTGSAGAGARCIAVAELHVELVDGEPQLLGRDGALQLYVGEDDHAHLRVFAPAQVDLPRLRLGESTPRVVVGEVVAQRESWNPTPERVTGLAEATGPRLVLAVAKLRAELGLPRHVFVSSPAETKPIYLDLESLPALEQLQRLAALGPLRLVEMLPAPQQLWLRRSAGSFTSELRLTMVRGEAG